jgi:hypothetical protein
MNSIGPSLARRSCLSLPLEVADGALGVSGYALFRWLPRRDVRGFDRRVVRRPHDESSNDGALDEPRAPSLGLLGHRPASTERIWTAYYRRQLPFGFRSGI